MISSIYHSMSKAVAIADGPLSTSRPTLPRSNLPRRGACVAWLTSANPPSYFRCCSQMRRGVTTTWRDGVCGGAHHGGISAASRAVSVAQWGSCRERRSIWDLAWACTEGLCRRALFHLVSPSSFGSASLGRWLIGAAVEVLRRRLARRLAPCADNHLGEGSGVFHQFF